MKNIILRWVLPLLVMLSIPLSAYAVTLTDAGVTVNEDRRLETSNFPAENSFTNEDTATSQNLCTASCFFMRHVTGVGDAGTTVEYYDEADATCDANKIITVDSASVASIAIGIKTVNGLCMKTIGHDTGNVTSVYNQ